MARLEVALTDVGLHTFRRSRFTPSNTEFLSRNGTYVQCGLILALRMAIPNVNLIIGCSDMACCSKCGPDDIGIHSEADSYGLRQMGESRQSKLFESVLESQDWYSENEAANKSSI
jgi:hypothetical protein